ASVFAPDAATADGLATACMVLGPEAGLALINRNENVEAYFIVGKSDGTMGVVVSKGLQHLLRQ
ncbi:MAG: FAD:protein FMN transferase, partial [Haliscomenobacter sp.]